MKYEGCKTKSVKPNIDVFTHSSNRYTRSANAVNLFALTLWANSGASDDRIFTIATINTKPSLLINLYKSATSTETVKT
jgi:hypothetical protein